MTCNSCYRYHLYILRKRKVFSTDRDLQQLINTITLTTSSINSINDLIDVNMKKVVAAVAT